MTDADQRALSGAEGRILLGAAHAQRTVSPSATRLATAGGLRVPQQETGMMENNHRKSDLSVRQCFCL